MKYVYTEGNYREFRGYMFWNGKPVNVTDRGTLEALKREHGFKFVDEEESKTTEEVNACPKCGRVVGKGRHFHIKYCKGAE